MFPIFAKDIALTVGAEVLAEFGITKIEGAAFSSITTTKQTTSSKLQITVMNEQALIQGGIYKKVVDTKLLEEYYQNNEYKKLIEENTSIQTITTIKTSQLKINKRRAVNTTNSTNITNAA